MQLLFIFVACDFASCKKIFVCAKFIYNISDDLPKKSQKKHSSIDRSIYHYQGVLEPTPGWTPRAFCSLSVEEQNTPGKHLV